MGASERFRSLRAKSNKLNAKLNQQQQYQLSSRGDPSSSSSSSTTSSSGSGLSSSATASSTASPPPSSAAAPNPAQVQLRTAASQAVAGVRSSSSPLNATVDSILNGSWTTKQRHV